MTSFVYIIYRIHSLPLITDLYKDILRMITYEIYDISPSVLTGLKGIMQLLAVARCHNALEVQ